MTSPTGDPGAPLRRGIYLLLVFVGVGAMLGRILAVDSVDRAGLGEHRLKEHVDQERRDVEKKGIHGEEAERIVEKDRPQMQAAPTLRRPFLSANDRSRWATVRALVEPEMRVPGAPFAIDRVVQQPNWDTIDMVKHGGHLYSSKPPLLPTLIAGEYWAIYRLTGMSLGTHPYEIGRFMLVTLNVIPLAIYFLLLAALVERLGKTDWERIFVMTAAVFGTFLTTFAVALNNHTQGAVCAMIALWAAVRIWFDGERRWRYFLLVGLFSGLLAADELPGLSLAAGLGLALLWKAPRQTLVAWLPAVALVAAGFFGTNWIAHDSLRPPYLHTHGTDNWYDYTYEHNGRQVESYWNHPQGLDRGEPSLPRYCFHALIGHHGIFSLTPIWLLSAAGTLMWLLQRRDRRLRELALLIGAVTVACVAFYLFYLPVDKRSYGGMTCGFRWVFWLTPLWLVVMLPAAGLLARRRWTMVLAALLLMLSVASTSYPTWNPWTNPWLMDYLKYLGRI